MILPWSLKRRVLYISMVLTVFATLLGWFLFVTYYEPPTCFDGEKNNSEAGIDCGGGCGYLCQFQVAEPVILFSRSFETVPGVYNAVAYIENPNFDIGTEHISYTFTLYDKDNNVIAERSGTTFIAAGYISPIFEGNIETGDSVPTRTVFKLGDARWKYVKTITESPFDIKNRELENADTRPRVKAVIENTSVLDFKNIEVVTVIFNALESAIATSRTVIESLPRKSSVPIVFTWPQPFKKELQACTLPVDILLLFDSSGSMNNDNANPPQPLTDAKNAAANFVKTLTPNDKVGVVTFATKSRVLSQLSSNHTATANLINNISILPEEETGSTNTGDAIRDATILFNQSLQNKDALRIMVLFTDGLATGPDEDPEGYALSQAVTAKNSGYTIYTIGLGNGVNASFLRTLASPEKNINEHFYFQAATTKELVGVYSQIADSICERGAAIIDIIPRIEPTSR